MFTLFAGADPGFQVRGAHLKELRRAKGGAKSFGVFRVKNHDFTLNNHIFSNFRGGARRVRPTPPPGSVPDLCLCLRIVVSNTYCAVFLLCLSSSCVTSFL